MIVAEVIGMQRKRIGKTKTKPKAKTTKMTSRARGTARKRVRISPRGDTRFVRRDDSGQFDDVVDVGRSLARDRKRKSKTVVPSGMGDRGDQKRRASKRPPAGTRTVTRRSTSR
jgi:hypothetical protein